MGLLELNQGRNELRNKFRIAPPAADGPESPLDLSKGVDEALVRLLNNLSTRAGSVEAIRDNFRELEGPERRNAGGDARRIRRILKPC